MGLDGPAVDWAREVTAMPSAYLEKLLSITGPIHRRGSHAYHEGSTPGDAERAVDLKVAELRAKRKRVTMGALQKAAAPFVEGCSSQKQWADAKQRAFVRIGHHLDPNTYKHLARVEVRDVPAQEAVK